MFLTVEMPGYGTFNIHTKYIPISENYVRAQRHLGLASK